MFNESKIKIIGVGCGGCDIVNHIYELGYKKKSFAVCEMNAMVLNRSKIPVKLQLGSSGLGSGNVPSAGREAAENAVSEIQSILKENAPQTVFIVSCFGGGCGTGAAPIIACESRKLDLNTIGIIVLPFDFEGTHKFNQALDGVREMAKHTDAIFIFNNQYLMRDKKDTPLSHAFEGVDNLISDIIKCISNFMTTPSKESAKKRIRWANLFSKLFEDL